MGKSGDQHIASFILHQQQRRLVMFPPVGWICAKLLVALCYTPYIIPMCARLPSHLVTLEQQPHRYPSSWQLVSKDQASVGSCPPMYRPGHTKRKKNTDCNWGETPVYQPRDRVWLATRDLQILASFWNWKPHYIRPYKILKRINEDTSSWITPL